MVPDCWLNYAKLGKLHNGKADEQGRRAIFKQ